MAYGFNSGTSGSFNTENNLDPNKSFYDNYKDPRGSMSAQDQDVINSWTVPKYDPSDYEQEPINWNKFGVAEPKKRFAGEVWDVLNKEQNRNRYSSQLNEPRGGYGGQPSTGGSGQILENLGVVYPQTHSPIVIPGQQGSSGGAGVGGDIGSLAGMGIGALIGGPAGAALGSQIGQKAGNVAGSFF